LVFGVWSLFAFCYLFFVISGRGGDEKTMVIRWGKVPQRVAKEAQNDAKKIDIDALKLRGYVDAKIQNARIKNFSFVHS